MLKRSLVIAIVLLLATAAGAHAVTLTTAPFPGEDFTGGLARCLVTNVGKKADAVTLELVQGDGVVLDTSGPFTLPPGQTAFGALSLFSNSSPTTCRITVPSKASYRGSFAYFACFPGTAPPTLIPAQ